MSDQEKAGKGAGAEPAEREVGADVPSVTAEMLAARVAELETAASAASADGGVGGGGPSGATSLRVLGREGLSAKTTADVAADEQKPAPIKVGTSAGADQATTGDLAPGEHKKLQAMLGAAKAKDSKTWGGLTGVKEKIESGSFDAKATVIFANCTDCEFELASNCTKVFLQACKNVSLTCSAKIVTSMLEIYKCQGITVQLDTKIGTLQCDMSRDIMLNFGSTEDFGSIIWAGCHKLRVALDDTGDALLTGFGDMQEEYADLNEERSQFKLHYLENKLVNEKVIRLPNGFPTTQREKDAFEARQEKNLKILAEKMGIVVPRAKRTGPKVKPNDKCSCGSGRKYKKCCGAKME